MTGDSGRIDAPADAALAPFRWYAAAAASAQEGALAFGQTAAEMTSGLLALAAQQAQIGLSWAEVLQRGFGSGVHFQEIAMRVSECMTRDVQIAAPDDTIATAARTMAQLDAGVLPVGENDRLVGMITDRDIAIRAIAQGKGPDARVGDVMNAEVKFCFDDQEVGDVLRRMGELQLRRMPVLNHDKRLVGIISLGDMAANGETQKAGDALCDISRPGGQHSQSLH